MRGPIENTAKRAAALAERFEAASVHGAKYVPQVLGERVIG
jgi:hypothetical protein